MSDPDFAEIEKAIGGKPDLVLGCGYEQGWPGLYIYDRKSGLVVASEDVEPTDSFAKKHLNHQPIGSAASPVVLLSPGERPTEPGWYVVQDSDGDREVAQVLSSMTRDGGFYVAFAGADMWDDLEDVLLRDKSTFIARIYPDRIEGREG